MGSDIFEVNPLCRFLDNGYRSNSEEYEAITKIYFINTYHPPPTRGTLSSSSTADDWYNGLFVMASISSCTPFGMQSSNQLWSAMTVALALSTKDGWFANNLSWRGRFFGVSSQPTMWCCQWNPIWEEILPKFMIALPKSLVLFYNLFASVRSPFRER